MHGNFNPSAPKNLKEKLEQTGRLWWLDKQFGLVTREDLAIPGFVQSISRSLYEKVAFWAETDSILQGTTFSEAQNLIADYAVSHYNIDVNGSTNLLPPNRAEAVQNS